MQNPTAPPLIKPKEDDWSDASDSTFLTELSIISRQFLCGFSIKYIRFEKLINQINWEEQKLLVEKTIQHPKNLQQSLRQTYQLSFLRSIINQLELNGKEIHDDLYEAFCTLQISDGKDQKYAFKHYLSNFGDDHVCISLKETISFISEGTTGLCSWQASIALSEWFLENSDFVKNKVMVELGSGTGLCGMIASLCCNASKVCLTDGSQQVLTLLKENLRRNIQANQFFEYEECCTIEYNNKYINTFLLDWEKVEDSKIDQIVEKPEIIFATDVIYNDALFPALLSALDYLFNMTGNTCIMLLAATVRNKHTLDNFINLLESKMFIISEEQYIKPTTRLFWDESTPIRIFRINRCSL